MNDFPNTIINSEVFLFADDAKPGKDYKNETRRD